MPTFNTGRGYSAEGQIINYEIINADYADFESDLFGEDWYEYTVKFDDVTRCIRGVVTFVAHKDDNAPVSIQNRIMTAYDNNDYKLA